MSLAHAFKKLADILWELGGIGAALELGFEHFGPADCGLGSGEACLAPGVSESTPLENTTCRTSFPRTGPRSSSRP